MDSSNEEKGLVLVFTGHGKGKTTAALGASLRAAGNGYAVIILQFIKGAWKYGELQALSHVPNIQIEQLGLGMVRKRGQTAKDHQKAREAWTMACEIVMSGRYQLVVLDEIHVAIRYGFIHVQELLDLLRMRPSSLHVILTGRDAPEPVCELADTVTEMRMIKHHYQRGIPAQKGVEW